MKVLDPGHSYELAKLDDGPPSSVDLVFVKREGEGYPGNVGHHSGTNLQEVMRVLIDRCEYLTGQAIAMGDLETVAENGDVVENLRDCIFILERRAARRHSRKLELTGPEISRIETLATCPKCGHIKPETHSHG